MKALTLFLLLVLALPVSAFADKEADLKARLQKQLDRVMSVTQESWYHRPNIRRADGAQRLFEMSVDIGMSMNDIKPTQLTEGDATCARILPEKDVFDAMCTVFGYTVSKYPSFVDRVAAHRAMGAIRLDGCPEPQKSRYNIVDLMPVDPGLILATGEGPAKESDQERFRALFRRAPCGGKLHWVLWSFYSYVPGQNDLVERPDPPAK